MKVSDEHARIVFVHIVHNRFKNGSEQENVAGGFLKYERLTRVTP